MLLTEKKVSADIRIQGVVQGVGFRPFIRNRAVTCNLTGWVLNYSGGVIIRVEGKKQNIEKFFLSLEEESPPPAVIVDKSINYLKEITGFDNFVIKNSRTEASAFTMISPDLSICPDCQQELLDSNDRRFHYPFINCTNCGPRYTIIDELPYDRPKTTMSQFNMCHKCKKEYNDPADRRYHAQPNACPECGPQISVIGPDGPQMTETPINFIIEALNKGEIVAIKGLGGFHLACDATNSKAVKRIREIKNRPDKALALMTGTSTKIREFAELIPQAEEVLKDSAHPIITLPKKENDFISPLIAPGLIDYGVFLPYTPLHILIFQENALYPALVMTSANRSGEPLIYRNEEMEKEVGELCDYNLTHDRKIKTRCDDSVVRFIGGKKTILRRARGYVPLPLKINTDRGKIKPHDLQVLAVGADRKNTFCLTRDGFAFVSQYIGDLADYHNLKYFKDTIDRMQKLFNIKPDAIACDLHPGYHTQHYAREITAENENKLVQVQHHHAHLVSCMVENRLDEEVIGIAFDGTGYGPDGTIWGGEFMICNRGNYTRVAHLKPVKLPGGEKAIKEPYRMVLSYLFYLYGKEAIDIISDISGFADQLDKHKIGKEKLELLWSMWEKGLNCPLTSSMGRLFDAVSSLLGIRAETTYEGQGAMEMEALAEEALEYRKQYNFEIITGKKGLIINPLLLLKDILNEVQQGIETSTIAMKFHNTVAEIILQISLELKRRFELNKVVLSGGVFQNRILTEKAMDLLKDNNFEVFSHSEIPPNDGGISLGQAAVALKRSERDVSINTGRSN